MEPSNYLGTVFLKDPHHDSAYVVHGSKLLRLL
jgi:hypothetical protein